MPLKILTHHPVNAMSFSTNKVEKQVLKIDNDKVAISYKDLGIVILNPIMDRLTFGFSPTKEFMAEYDPAQTVEDLEQYLRTDLYHRASLKSDNLSLLEKVSFLKPPYSSYKINVKYTPTGAASHVLIQVSPKQPKNQFFRFDMNPSKFNQAQMAEFQSFIEDLLSTGSPVPFDAVKERSYIHRVDVAVDILGARPADMDVIPLVEGKPAKKKSHVYKSASGRQETVYPGSTIGEAGKSYIYDKQKELAEKNSPPMFGDFLHSRYEIRCEKQKFATLATMNNRLNRVSVNALHLGEYEKLHYTQQLFIRYVLDRTLEKGLVMIPAKFRPRFLKAYEKCTRKIWDAPLLWSLWKTRVAKTGFILCD